MTSAQVGSFLHKMLISNIGDEIAGRWIVWIAGNEFARVANYIAPPPSEVVERLESMLSEYNAISHESIIKRIARLHLTLECTHPVIDGNGRIGRVIPFLINLYTFSAQKYYFL